MRQTMINGMNVRISTAYGAKQALVHSSGTIFTSENEPSGIFVET